VLQNILADVTATGSSLREEWQKSLALSLAYNAAGGQQTLTEAEQKELIEQLFRLPSFTRTPDGKIVLLRMTEEEIARKF
jgi:DNA mismatch repair ATPase MutL